MDNKYELTDTTKEVGGHILHQIKALKFFDDVMKGELGGWIESYQNLSQSGNAWVYDGAEVFENAKVYDNAKVYGYAKVYGQARVYDDACIFDFANVCGHAHVCGDAKFGRDLSIDENNLTL